MNCVTFGWLSWGKWMKWHWNAMRSCGCDSKCYWSMHSLHLFCEKTPLSTLKICEFRTIKNCWSSLKEKTNEIESNCSHKTKINKSFWWEKWWLKIDDWTSIEIRWFNRVEFHFQFIFAFFLAKMWKREMEHVIKKAPRFVENNSNRILFGIVRFIFCPYRTRVFVWKWHKIWIHTCSNHG